MAIGCGAKCAKAMLIIFNLLFWLAGGAILSIGIWVVVDSNIINTFNVIKIDPSDHMITYAAYLLIAVGAFIVLVAFLGCCGAMQESKCMLVSYFLILLLIFVGLLVAGILAIIYKEKASDSLQEFLRKSLEKYGEEDSITKAWDYVQFSKSCCGYNTPEDYQEAKAWKMKNSNLPFPISCCVHTKDSVQTKIIPQNQDQCQRKQSGLYFTLGCHDVIKTEINRSSAIMIGVAFGIAGLVIFGMIFSICLCRNIGQEI